MKFTKVDEMISSNCAVNVLMPYHLMRYGPESRPMANPAGAC